MPVRRLLSGFAVLAALTFLTQLIGFIALAVAARQLGPADLGAANFALNIAIYFGIPANFGLTLLGIRDIARHPERARETAGDIVLLRTALGLITFAALVVATPVLATDELSRTLLPIAALAIPLDALAGDWILLGAQRPRAANIGRLLGQLVYAVLIVLLLTGGVHGAKQFVWYTVLSILIATVVSQALATRAIGRPRPSSDVPSLRARAVASLPLGVAVIMVQVSASVGILMLGYLASATAVGQFSVAQKLPLAFLNAIQLWSAVLYPQVATLIDEHKEELRAQIALFMRISLALAVPLAAGGAVLGTDLVVVLFGDAYRPAGTTFSIIIGSLALALVTVNVGSVLAAGGDERRYAVGRTIGAVTTVAVGAVAIPLEGVEGAAIAMLVAEAVVLAYMARRYRRVVGAVEVDLQRLGLTFVATAVMCGVLLVLGDGVNVGVRILAGAATYGVAGLALGVVRPDELQRLRPGRAATSG